MARELISRKTRIEFREYFVGLTLSEISDEYDSADIECDRNYTPRTSGQRRSLVEQYYHTLDLANWRDVRKLMRVYEVVLSSLEVALEAGSTYDPKATKATLLSLQALLRKDGFQWENDRLSAAREPLDLPASAGISKLDSPELYKQLERIRESVDADPALAVGTAKELVETTCKTILEERGVDFRGAEDLGGLVKSTRGALGLLPEDIPDSAKGVETIRRLLSNLGTIAQALGELRNLYGTGHGRTSKARGLRPRHARLAVGAASTLVTFLFGLFVSLCG